MVPRFKSLELKPRKADLIGCLIASYSLRIKVVVSDQCGVGSRIFSIREDVTDEEVQIYR